MRWLLALIGVAACRIPGEHFIGPGGGADGGGDGNGGADANIGVGLTKGYIIDSNAGIFHVAKNANGGLTLASATPTAVSMAQSAVVNKQGTRLIVVHQGTAGPSQVLDFPINVDGTLGTPSSQSLGGCNPRYTALHPSGNFIAVGCANPNIALVRLGPTGAVTQATTQAFTAVNSPANLVFSPDGNCLFVADSGATAVTPVVPFQFDPSSGSMSMIAGGATMPVGATGIAAHPTKSNVYVSGFGNGGVVTLTYTSSCTIQTMGAPRGCGPTSSQAVVSPTGDRLFVTGPGVYVFDIDSNGLLLPTTTSPTLMGTTSEGAIFDPARPNILYLTASSGTFPATIMPNGSMTAGAAVTTAGTNNRWFVMAP